MTEVQKTNLARLMIHEYYHNLGTARQDRSNYKYDFTDKWNVNFVKDIIIKKIHKVKITPTGLKVARYFQAEKNLRKAQTRLKRATSIFKKWQSKVKRYKKVLKIEEKAS